MNVCSHLTLFCFRENQQNIMEELYSICSLNRKKTNDKIKLKKNPNFLPTYKKRETNFGYRDK